MERLDSWTLTLVDFVVLVIFILIQSTCAQKGFTSLECCGESSYTDTNTNISWQPDDRWFPDRSNCRTIIRAAQNNSGNYSLRVFDSVIANKWCYNFTTTVNQAYLIRGTFSSADQETLASAFNVSIGVTPISQVKSLDNEEVEGIFKARGNYEYFCLVEANGDLSISKVELRPMVDSKYTDQEPNSVLKLIARVYLGNTGVPVRYPDDQSDRIWKQPSISMPNYTSIQSSSPNTSAYFFVPSIPRRVLETALHHYDRLDFNHSDLDAGAQNYLVYLYFLELNASVAIGQRVFDVYINNRKLLDGVDIMANGSSYKQYVFNVSVGGSLNLSLVRVSNGSQFGPILNAYEVMQVLPWVQESNQHAVNVIVEVKNELLKENANSELLEGWTGDPCLPVKWRGVTCQLINGSNVITELDLSLHKLNGFLPASVTQLTDLTRLNLSNNGFIGSVPEFPARSMLTSVDLSHNKLTGKIPPSLISLPHLTALYFGCNPYFSKELPMGFNINRTFTSDYGRCGYQQDSPAVHEIIIGTVACGSILLGVAIGIILLYCRRHKLSAPLGFEGHGYTTKSTVFALPSMDEFIIDAISVQNFTLEYIENVTQKYKTLIGEGGFGSVYRGTLSDGEEVAVKVRSATSTQGTREFENELNLLSDIRHENLVPLLGYCWENEQQILVYPYMSNGSLQDRLYGEAAKRKTLDWPTRLSIALGAARGLTYLHTYAGGCVIHRDVKSSNILLDHSMCAKVADFGFSKYAPQEGDSGVSLEVKGTAGYLDPEYYSTQHLSTKSDVFSFGVVLLEIVTGREPLNIQRPRNEWSLVEWAKPHIGNQKIEEILDPSIKGGYHSEAMWRVVEAALACIEPYGAYRPSMADIVRELEDALIIENNASEYMRSIDSLGGSARYSLPTEKRILQVPTKSTLETSTAVPELPSLPQPR